MTQEELIKIEVGSRVLVQLNADDTAVIGEVYKKDKQYYYVDCRKQVFRFTEKQILKYAELL